MDRFSTQEECLKFLEELRWGGEPCCIHCGSIRVGRKNHNHIEDGWNCYDCASSFSVIAGTMFHKTRIPLRKWFLAISIILNSKKSISSTALRPSPRYESKICLVYGDENQRTNDR